MGNYCLVLLKKDVKELNLNVMGGAIGSLIVIAENVKLLHPGLFQTSTISTLNSQTVTGTGDVLEQKLFPKLEIVLTTVQPDAKNIGYQAAHSEEDRERTRRPQTQRGGRGQRGAPRGRGQRGGQRGAPRGQRGGQRGAPRGRGQRGAPRGRGQEVHQEELPEEEEDKEEHPEEAKEETEEDKEETEVVIKLISNKFNSINFFFVFALILS